MIGLRMAATALLSIWLVAVSISATEQEESGLNGDLFTLTRSEASHFASLALKCVAREYPNKSSTWMV